MMEKKNIVELEDCPACQGTGLIVHEGGWSVQVECVDCGAHTVFVEYGNEAEMQEAVRRVSSLWNMGKVIKMDPGE